MRKLELVKVKKVLPEITIFYGQFYQEVEIISKQKVSFLKKKLTLLAFLGESKKLSQPREPTVTDSIL